MKRSSRLFALILSAALFLSGCASQSNPEKVSQADTEGPLEGDVIIPEEVSRVDTEGPLEGDVIIAVNTSYSIDDPLSVGTLPSDDGDYSQFENLKVSTGIPLEFSDTDITIESGKQVVGNETPEKSYSVGDKKSFKTIDFYKRMMKSFGDPAFADYDDTERLDVEIELVYSGKYCTIWAQTDPIYQRPDISVSLDLDMAKKIADEFDSKIFPIITNTYGPLYDVDGDGKFAIVCADFIDYYNYEVYDNYFLQGYCNPLEDSVPVAQGGNGTEMDMMLLDIWPTLYNDKNEPADENWMVAMQTIAHELTHYVCFSAQNLIPGKTEVPESWIQESFTTFSETLYKGKVADDTFGFYKSDESSVVANGRSPIEFQGMMEDYALVNMFSLYLYEQTKDLEGGGTKLFRTIIESNYSDYHAIENALKDIGYPVTDFSDLIFNFRVAIIANEDSGIYGFNKNENVQDLPIHFYKNADGNFDEKTLAGGGAIVFKNVDGGFTPEGNDENVRFAGIKLEK